MLSYKTNRITHNGCAICWDEKHHQCKLLKSRGLGTSIHRHKLEWDAATPQLAHGHNYFMQVACCCMFFCILLSSFYTLQNHHNNWHASSSLVKRPSQPSVPVQILRVYMVFPACRVSFCRQLLCVSAL